MEEIPKLRMTKCDFYKKKKERNTNLFVFVPSSFVSSLVASPSLRSCPLLPDVPLTSEGGGVPSKPKRRRSWRPLKDSHTSHRLLKPADGALLADFDA